MPPSARRCNHRAPRARSSTKPRVGRNAWLAPPIGASIIVGLAYAAAGAQATAEVFVAAAMVFSLCEGVVLAVVGWAWSPRGVAAATIAAAVTAAVAAPARWEVSHLAGYMPTFQPVDLLLDLLVSVAWGALAGLAGATILRSRLTAMMRTDRERFTRQPPR
jgi:hypothetical protein